MSVVQASIVEQFQHRFGKSAELFARAQRVFPGGITHDTRQLDPFPIYVNRAQGAHKWTVEGHDLVDYWMGHGSLMMGHNPPAVTAAIVDQLQYGTHYGACHELEVRWGELVQKLVPSAERVKFTSSGTEATMLALRLARAYTGRSKVLRFHGHFHGWHDWLSLGIRPPFDQPASTGIPGILWNEIIGVEPNDLEAVERALSAGDVACAILEPAGGSMGKVPSRPEFLSGLRELTRKYGTVLIFDEVVSGFRYGPGGAQEYFGVTPDVTTLAKIVSGGVPGGALCGRADIMDGMNFKPGDPQWNRTRRVNHQGTYNANPLAAAAGIAALTALADGQPQRRAARVADFLRDGMHEVLRRRGVQGAVFGDSSFVHVAIGIDASGYDGTPASLAGLGAQALMSTAQKGSLLRKALLLQGVDWMGITGLVSSAHTDEDAEKTIAAFDRAIEAMQREGAV